MLTAGQLRAARALLGIDQVTLAQMAHVSAQTIEQMERCQDKVDARLGTVTRVIDALDAAGIELTYIGGRGVRLRSDVNSALSGWSEFSRDIWLR